MKLLKVTALVGSLIVAMSLTGCLQVFARKNSGGVGMKIPLPELMDNSGQGSSRTP